MPLLATRLRRQVPYLLCLLVLAASLVYLLVEPGHWRRGTTGIAAAMLLAAVLRLMLPAAKVGMLHVRGRRVDTALYLVAGGLILGLAIRLG